MCRQRWRRGRGSCCGARRTGCLRSANRGPVRVASLHREPVAGKRAAPQKQGTFKVSKDPEFAEKVADIVGLYLYPPGGAVVLSLDEKTQIQALDRTQP